MTLAAPSEIDLRHGEGAELLLRTAIIVVDKGIDGVGVAELRRLLGHPRDALDRMSDAQFRALVERADPFRGSLLMIARDPRRARGVTKRLRLAVETVAEAHALPNWLRVGKL